MTLDPAGLAAAQLEWTTYNLDDPAAWREAVTAAVRAYLAAAVLPAGENEPREIIARMKARSDLHPWPGAVNRVEAEEFVRAAFAAGRAAATETIPREDALQALHEMSTVAGLLRVRRDDPAVVALGDRLRLACRALRDVTAPGMNELMDSQPGRAAAPDDDDGPFREDLPAILQSVRDGQGTGHYEHPVVPLHIALAAVTRAEAAGRAAASPDPPDMTNMCEGESPDHKPGITPAASPDERLREAAKGMLPFLEAASGDIFAVGQQFDCTERSRTQTRAAADAVDTAAACLRIALAAADRPQPPADERLREAAQVAVFACLPVLHIVGSQNRGYRVSDVIDPKVIADPQEWVDAAHAICELHHVLAAADRDSGDVAIERLGNAVIEANRRGPIPPVSDDPDFLAADREKPDAGPDGEDLP